MYYMESNIYIYTFFIWSQPSWSQPSFWKPSALSLWHIWCFWNQARYTSSARWALVSSVDSVVYTGGGDFEDVSIEEEDVDTGGGGDRGRHF